MEPAKINITICGDGGCGKSSITLRLVRSQWTHEYDPTIEDSYSLTRTVDGKPYLLSITDTAGQEEYRSLWAASNLRADAFILVYDITSPSSLHEQLPMFAGMIAAEADRRHDVGDVPPVTIVVGNKCDLSANRKVTAKTGWEWSRSWGWGFMETSARDCVNVEETFTLLIRRVSEARQLHALPRSKKQLTLHTSSAMTSQRGVGSGLALNEEDQYYAGESPVSHFEKEQDEGNTRKSWWQWMLCCGRRK